ncbi:MAG: hypothetical protein ACE14V_10245 [bacterium]
MRHIFSLILSIISLIFWFSYYTITDGATIDTYIDSPFGIHGKTYELGLPVNPPPGLKENLSMQYQKLGLKSETDWNNKIAGFEKDIGIKWDRIGLGFTLANDLITRADRLVQNTNKQGVNLVFTISYQNRPIPGNDEADRIQQLVERYDGDGVNDMPGLTQPVLYWQIGNEPEGRVKPEEYLELLKYAYKSVKKASPRCQVILAGLEVRTSPEPTFIDSILKSGAGAYFDILDIHIFGNARGEYHQIEKKYLETQKILKKYGVDKPIWITETGTASGTFIFPREPDKKFSQTEKEQAIDLVHRYIISLGLGIKKVFWAWGLVEDYGFMRSIDGFFDHTGLIYNGLGLDDQGPFVKKLSYYSYKKMIEKLEGSDWSKTSRMGNLPIGINGVRFIKSGKPIYVLWSDYESQISIPFYIADTTATKVTITEAIPNYDTGKQVTDYTAAFAISTAAVKKGAVTVILSDKPVYIE